MKQGIGSYEALREEVDRRARNKLDVVVDVKDVSVTQDGGAVRLPLGSGYPHDQTFKWSQHSLDQVGTWCGIHKGYMTKMQSTQKSKTLIHDNINYWFQNRKDNRANRMFRCTKDGNKVHAFLSDMYARIDDEIVLDSLDPVLDSLHRYELGSCNVHDKFFNVKVLLPELEHEVKRGQVVRGGFMASNSSIGLRQVDLNRFIRVVMCDNGMMGDRPGDGVRRVHRSVRLPRGILPQYWESSVSLPYDIIEDFKKVVENCTSIEGFKGYVQTMKDATEGEKVRYLDRISEKLPTIPSVEWIGDKFNLTSPVKIRITDAFLSVGDYSKWGFVNGVTNAANLHADYDEATRLEQLGGKILEFNNYQWSDIARAEYRKAA